MHRWFNLWLPLLIPGVLLLLKLLASWKFGRFDMYAMPSDLSYYGTTVYVWATTTLLQGQRFGLISTGQEGPYVLVMLLSNMTWFYVCFPYPPTGTDPPVWLAVFLLVAFTLSLISAIVMRRGIAT